MNKTQRLDYLMVLLKDTTISKSQHKEVVDAIAMELSIVVIDKVQTNPNPRDYLRIDFDNGRAYTKTGSAYLTHGGSIFLLKQKLEITSKVLAEQKFDYEKTKNYFDHLTMLHNSTNEILATYDLVQEEYNEILVDLTLRAGDEL